MHFSDLNSVFSSRIKKYEIRMKMICSNTVLEHFKKKRKKKEDIIRNHFPTERKIQRALEKSCKSNEILPNVGFITNSQWQFFTVVLLELRNYTSAVWSRRSPAPLVRDINSADGVSDEGVATLSVAETTISNEKQPR